MGTRVLTGDCREVLPTLESGSVQMCVTSPPYWQLRDYGVAGQTGLEPTPEEYVAQLVAVFREVRRVLKDDGVLWLNLGDTYSREAANGQHKPGESGKQGYVYDIGAGRASASLTRVSTEGSSDGAVRRADRPGTRASVNGLKPKDLVGVPWMVALALRADGWYLRSDVIWSKRNPLPESVTDRPTKAHEYVFLLSKGEHYYYNARAIAERATGRAAGNVSHKGASALEAGDEHMRTKGGLTRTKATKWRNKRSVWTLSSEPCREAHFAVMPSALVVPCILAGSRIGDTVLDPFVGSGTVGRVATELGRKSILIELSPEHSALADRRTAQGGLFTEASPDDIEVDEEQALRRRSFWKERA
jgi:DNA modification methylase